MNYHKKKEETFLHKLPMTDIESKAQLFKHEDFVEIINAQGNKQDA